MIAQRLLATALLAGGLLLPSIRADGWVGYMNVFDNNSGSAGNFSFGSGWGLPDLKTTTLQDVPSTIFGDQFLLEPNFNTYTNSLPGLNTDRAFWTNSSDGGATAGPLGNKFMEANTFVETLNVSIPSVNFSGTVNSFTLDGAYTALAFIKVLNQNNGYSLDLFQTFNLGSGSSFSLDANLAAHQGKILQTGFLVSGVNANIANGSLGNVDVTVVASVPEPSSFAAIFGGVAVVFAASRRRRR